MLRVSLLLHWLTQFPLKYVSQFGSLWFFRIPQDQIYASWHNDFQMSEQFHSLFQIFTNQPISSFICKARHFVFLITVCDVRIFIQLHKRKLRIECEAAPIIRTKSKCCRNVEERRQEKCRFMQIRAFIQLILF